MSMYNPDVPDILSQAGEDATEQEKLAALSLAFTETTDQPLEAFEQWSMERQALTDFYGVSQAFDQQLTELRGHWKAMRHALYGAGGITTNPRKEIDWVKVADAARALNAWERQVQEVADQHKDAVEGVVQLKLFEEE